MTNPPNLLKPEWAEIDSADLRLLLESRVGAPGQYTGVPKDNRLFVPDVRTCKVILRFRGNRVSSIEPGEHFNRSEWATVSTELDALRTAKPSTLGKDFAFSSYRVSGWWRGARSGVQILPPPAGAPVMPWEIGRHPFVLEFPLLVDREWTVTNQRRRREHRRIALLLNVLLVGRVSVEPRQTEFSWATIPLKSKLPIEVVQSGQEDWPQVEWVQCSYMAKLDVLPTEAPSTPSGDPLEVVTPGAYYELRGLDGKGLRVPADLDEAIYAYQNLDRRHQERFDRALFWMDLASAQWTTSMSSSFASLVSAVEALTERGSTHTVYCNECKKERSHDVPGSTALFRSFFEKYAPGQNIEERRKEMYDLRSSILHGDKLIAFDEGLAMGWDPPWRRQNDLHGVLWSLTRVALRNYLRDPPVLTKSRAAKRAAGRAERIRQFLCHPIGISRRVFKQLIRRAKHAVRSRLWHLKNRRSQHP